jgi:small subunit ribosomal protein S21
MTYHPHLFLQGRPTDREGGIELPGIRVKDGESFESALRRFKKKCEKAGIMADLRRHQHFEKPSERRKRKLNAAKRKNMAKRTQEN